MWQWEEKSSTWIPKRYVLYVMYEISINWYFTVCPWRWAVFRRASCFWWRTSCSDTLQKTSLSSSTKEKGSTRLPLEITWEKGARSQNIFRISSSPPWSQSKILVSTSGPQGRFQYQSSSGFRWPPWVHRSEPRPGPQVTSGVDFCEADWYI